MGLFASSGYPAPHPVSAGFVDFTSGSGASGFSGAAQYQCDGATRIVRVCPNQNAVIGFSGFSGANAIYFATEGRDHYVPSGYVGEYAVDGGAMISVASTDGSDGRLHISELEV